MNQFFTKINQFCTQMWLALKTETSRLFLRVDPIVLFSSTINMSLHLHSHLRRHFPIRCEDENIKSAGREKAVYSVHHVPSMGPRRETVFQKKRKIQKKISIKRRVKFILTSMGSRGEDIFTHTTLEISKASPFQHKILMKYQNQNLRQF